MFDIGKITHQLKIEYRRLDQFILVNTMQVYERVWVQAPLTFQLGTIQTWMVKFAPRPFYLPGERPPGTEGIRGWLGPRGDLIFFFWKRKDSSPIYKIEQSFSGCPSRGLVTAGPVTIGLVTVRCSWSLSVRNSSSNLTFNLLIYFDLFLGTALPLTYGRIEIQREEKKLKLIE